MFSYNYFGPLTALVTVVTMNFLDGFFLMNSLWVPPKTWMVVYRLWLWLVIGNMAFRELYNAVLCKENNSGNESLMIYYNDKVCSGIWLFGLLR